MNSDSRLYGFEPSAVLDVMARGGPLLYEIALFLDWEGLMNLAKACYFSRAVVQKVVRHRAWRILRTIVTDEQRAKIFELMQATGAVIMGAVPWAVMNLDIGGEHYPENLQLAVPSGCFQEWKELVVSFGFYIMEGMAMEFPKHRGLQRAKRFVRKGDNDNRFVSIVETNDSRITSAIVTAATTADMVYMDHSQVVCLYPLFLKRRQALEGFFKRESTKIGWSKGRQVTVFRNNVLWDKPCGSLCPAITRLSYSAKWIGVFEWNSDMDEDYKVDHFGYPYGYGKGIKWRLGKICFNAKCRWCDFWAQ